MFFKNGPESLKDFFMTAKRLSILQEPTFEHQDLCECLSGIKAKKEHELRQLGRLIHDECMKLNITRIVDIGCGMVRLIYFYSVYTIVFGG